MKFVYILLLTLADLFDSSYFILWKLVDFQLAAVAPLIGTNREVATSSIDKITTKISRNC